jgi:Skp family chaperone for outer membrane proteins
MIAYAVILFVAPILGLLFYSSIIEQLALAATLSGIFFAMADLCSNLSDEWKKQIKIEEQELNEIDSLSRRMIKLFEQIYDFLERKYRNAKNPEQQYRVMKKKVQLRKLARKFRRKFLDNRGRLKFHNKPQRRSNAFKVFYYLCFSLGIITFLFILLFPEIIKPFEYRQELFSIYGFAFVFLNYLITDTTQERITRKLKKYKDDIAEIKKMRKDVEKITKELEKDSKVTQEQDCHLEQEELTNGKTENAQPQQS